MLALACSAERDCGAQPGGSGGWGLRAVHRWLLRAMRRAQISVDGDTSTNDTVLGLASGAAGGSVITEAASPDGQQLQAAVTALLQVSIAPGSRT